MNENELVDNKLTYKELQDENKQLKNRLNELADAFAQREAIQVLYSEIIQSIGFDSMVNKILDVIMQLYGGKEVGIAYYLGDTWYYQAIGENKTIFNPGDKPLINEALINQKTVYRLFRENIPMPGGNYNLPAEHQIAFPLLVNEKIIGIILLEGVLVIRDSIFSELDVFMKYLSLALYNEMEKYQRTEEAYNELDQIFQSSPDGMVYVDMDGAIIRMNTALQKMLKTPRTLLFGKTLNSLLSLPGIDFDDLKERTLRRASYETDLELMVRGGKVISVIITSRLMRDNQNKPIGIIINIKDITDRIKTQNKIRDLNSELQKIILQLENQLQEKEVMMKEIHHRVKNNLQVIYSLIQLQIRYLSNQDVINYLNDTANRVRTMGLIHELLYNSENLSKINFTRFIQDLSMHLLNLYQSNDRRTKLNLERSSRELPLDQAIPCGLILNEAMTNSLKYAFPNGRKGSISVTLNQDDTECVFSISDDGIGIAPDIDINNSASLGLKLIKSLTMQLNGNLSVVRNNGTSFTIRFPKG